MTRHDHERDPTALLCIRTATHRAAGSSSAAATQPAPDTTGRPPSSLVDAPLTPWPAHLAVVLDLAQTHRGVLRPPAELGWSAAPALLIEFEAIGTAVSCALAIQRQLEALNASLDADARCMLRIAVSSGYFAEGNPAIRAADLAFVERLCEDTVPGGVWISATAAQMVTQRLTPADLRNDAPPPASWWAPPLQMSLLVGYFLFWCGLIVWRNWYTAVHHAPPCWPSFLCN